MERQGFLHVEADDEEEARKAVELLIEKEAPELSEIEYQTGESEDLDCQLAEQHEINNVVEVDEDDEGVDSIYGAEDIFKDYKGRK